MSKLPQDEKIPYAIARVIALIIAVIIIVVGYQEGLIKTVGDYAGIAILLGFLAFVTKIIKLEFWVDDPKYANYILGGMAAVGLLLFALF